MRVQCVCVGQSNELGTARKSDGVSAVDIRHAEVGFPQSNLLNNKIAGQGRGYWDMVAEKLYSRFNLSFEMRPTPVSGTSIATNWCGRDGGDNHVLNHTEGGFDPSGYFANALDEITGAKVDETWAIICIGQNDAATNTTRADFAQGYINTAEWAFSNGFDRVFMGLTIHSLADLDNGYRDQLNPGVSDALANYSADSRVQRGANLYITLGDASTLHLYDDNHAAEPTVSQMAESWASSIGDYLKQ